MTKHIFLFDTDRLETLLTSLMDGHVTYELGDKVYQPLRVEPEDVTSLDCSGFIKYVVQRTTLSNESMPAGSHHQETWCQERLIRCDYATDASSRDGSVLIAFRDKTPSLIRHVWLVINAWTVECTNRNGRNGPTSFRWDDRRDEADDCFWLGDLSPPRFDAQWIQPWPPRTPSLYPRNPFSRKGADLTCGDTAGHAASVTPAVHTVQACLKTAVRFVLNKRNSLGP